jgi:uncharacterized protein (DUF1501 family)
MTVSRRQLLKMIGGGGIALGTGAWVSMLRDHAEDATTAATTVTTTACSSQKRTLVLVQLAGGNDGLNTIVPDDGRYRDARPTLGIAEDDVLHPKGVGGFGLHPALAPLVPYVDAGQLTVVQSVGLMHQSRSHFECSQHWWDGSDGHHMSDTGWVGRWLDATKPSGEVSPLRAVAIGGQSGTAALRADESRSTVVVEPASFTIADAAFETAYRNTGDASVVAALDAVDLLADPLSGAPAGNGTLTDSLKVAAELVIAGLGIEVILVGNGGFDTHSGQAATQERLLADLAGGIAAFQSAVTDAGAADRALLLTTSEFGRRVAENGSAGSDHGLGNCLLAVGTSLKGGVVGELDLADLTDGDIMPTIDPRSYLASGLTFLGGDVDEVFDDWEDLHLLA